MNKNTGLNEKSINENSTSCAVENLSMNKNNQVIDSFFKDRCKSVHISALEKGPCLTTSDTIQERFGVNKEIEYEYWHYLCDGFDDRGWGCGYRTLQTISSWIIERKGLKSSKHLSNVSSKALVPSIPDIQRILVEDLKDKDSSFVGSRGWIGSFEVCLILDYLYDVPCKIIHTPAVEKNGKLQHSLFEHVDDVKNHFMKNGSPVMMGGDVDASSKGIFGIATTENNKTYLLVVDPHFWKISGKCSSNSSTKFCAKLEEEGWIKWKCLETDFCDNSFYNFCLPQIKSS